MNLRIIRILISFPVLVLFVFGLLYPGALFLDKFSSYLTDSQFIPSFIKLYKSGILGIALILIPIITIFFGRIYCSTICPLGTIQDCFILIGKRRFKYYRIKPLYRYGIPLIAIVLFLVGIPLFLIEVESYSLAARLINTMTNLPEGYYLLSFSFICFIASTFIIIVLLFMSIFFGRLYCNTLCPTGAILSLFSFSPLLSVRLNKNNCISCRKCETTCKAGCINSESHTIDSSMCISCFRCISTCNNKAVKYGFKKRKRLVGNKCTPIETKKQFTRKDFLQLTAIGILGYSASKLIPFRIPKKIPFTPPGSKGLKHFTETCTACHICISKCPSKVLRPALYEYGIGGIMQTTLDFNVASCIYNCNLCSLACPNGAILPVSVKEKQKISIGTSAINKKICIVYKDKTACAACHEMCPTGAVYMIHTNILPAPKVNNDICIGCGACQKACPTKPVKAIIVTARNIHTKITGLPIEKGFNPVSMDGENTDFAF